MCSVVLACERISKATDADLLAGRESGCCAPRSDTWRYAANESRSEAHRSNAAASGARRLVDDISACSDRNLQTPTGCFSAGDSRFGRS